MKISSLYRLRVVLVGLCCLLLASGAQYALAETHKHVASQTVREEIRDNGQAHVIVKFGMAQQQRGEIGLSRAAIQRQRAEIRQGSQNVRDQLQGTAYRVRREFTSLPYIAMDVDAHALAKLEALGSNIEGIYEDVLLAPMLADSILQIEADLAHQEGFDGSGRVVVIIDSGVDKQHPFLAGKVTAEACFAASEDGSAGACPNGQATQLTAGAGVPCTFEPGCRHGTHVAGIAAGAGASFTGVAPGADLISIQVFHPSSTCFGTPVCASAFTSDLVAALDHVYTIRDQFPISSVNMSLGGQTFAGDCDAEFPAVAAAMENLRAAGIAPVVASGNSGETAAISSPACVSAAISVAAVDDNDNVAGFSSVASGLELFAPGTTINSSIPGGGFEFLSGTSMAAPHVAGAWAVLDHLNPDATVDDQLTVFEFTGAPVIDDRGGSGITKPRIRLSGAVGIESPVPILNSVAPATLSAWGPDTTLVISGADFVRGSGVLVDGVPLPTTYVSATELSTTLTASRLATSATSLSIHVSSPPPGGGASNAIALQLTQPTLTAGPSTAAPGDPITVTVANPPGRTNDWLALAAVGAPNTSYVDFIYVPTGVSSFSWTTSAPAQFGNYEFRLFSNNGFSLITTSSTVAVESLPPVVTAISPGRVAAFSGDLTLTIDGTDFVSTSEVLIDGQPRPTIFIRDTRLKVTIPAADLATAATSLAVSVTSPAPGGGVSNVVSLQLAHPALSVSSSSVAPGSDVTVTLTDGVGNDRDWLAFARVGDAEQVFIQYVYVGSGVTSRTWTVTMPSGSGDYEFRLFKDDGYTRLATSETVTADTVPPDPPTPTTPTVDVSADTVNGGEIVTVTLSNGPGNSNDWLALAEVGDPNTVYTQWTYVPAGATAMIWDVTMPTTAGAYEFRLFEKNSTTLLATSTTVTVVSGPPDPPTPPTPTLDVSADTVNGGEIVTVTLSDGPGNTNDWLALAEVGDPNSVYIQWIYVPAGATAMNWDVTMPTTAGAYEFRLFEKNSTTLLATSTTVTVDSGPPDPPPPPTPTVDVSADTVNGGEIVTVTLSGGPGNTNDWLALAKVGDPITVYTQWIYVPAGATTMTWDVTMPTIVGAYEFRLFEKNSFTLLATSPIVTVDSLLPPPPPPAATLDLSATSVAPGEDVTVTLSNGPGNATDWIALASVGDPNSVYLDWVYVGSGQTSTTWTVSMPATVGDFEFRLFENNGFNRLATSGTVTVGQ